MNTFIQGDASQTPPPPRPTTCNILLFSLTDNRIPHAIWGLNSNDV